MLHETETSLLLFCKASIKNNKKNIILKGAEPAIN